MTRPRITGSQIAFDARIAAIQPGCLERRSRVDIGTGRAGRPAARCPGSRRIAKPMPITAASAWATPLATWRAAYRPGRSRSSRSRRAAALPGAGASRTGPSGADQLGARDAHAVPRHHDAHLDPVAGHDRVGAVRLRLGHRARRRPAAARGPWSAWTRGRPRCGGRRARSRRRWARPPSIGAHAGGGQPPKVDRRGGRRSTAAGGSPAAWPRRPRRAAAPACRTARSARPTGSSAASSRIAATASANASSVSRVSVSVGSISSASSTSSGK